MRQVFCQGTAQQRSWREAIIQPCLEPVKKRTTDSDLWSWAEYSSRSGAAWTLATRTVASRAIARSTFTGYLLVAYGVFLERFPCAFFPPYLRSHFSAIFGCLACR